jgi:hypothetical protein
VSSLCLLPCLLAEPVDSNFVFSNMPGVERKPKTLYDKVFEDHIVNEQEGGTILLYIGMLQNLNGA